MSAVVSCWSVCPRGHSQLHTQAGQEAAHLQYTIHHTLRRPVVSFCSDFLKMTASRDYFLTLQSLNLIDLIKSSSSSETKEWLKARIYSTFHSGGFFLYSLSAVTQSTVKQKYDIKGKIQFNTKYCYNTLS